MRKIFEEFGGVIVTVVAVCCLIGFCAYIMMPTGIMADAFGRITSMFTDKSQTLIQDVGSIDGNGGGSGTGGNGGSSEVNDYGFFSGFYVGTDGETTLGLDFSENAIADNYISLFGYFADTPAFFAMTGFSFDNILETGEILSESEIEFNGIIFSLSDECSNFPVTNDVYYTKGVGEVWSTITIGEQNTITIKIVDSDGTSEVDANYVAESRYLWAVNSQGLSSVHPSYDGQHMMLVFTNGDSFSYTLVD